MDQSAIFSPDELQQQICVCYDVYLTEIVEQLEQGVLDVDQISDATYACQGCGGCRPKVEKLVEHYQNIKQK